MIDPERLAEGEAAEDEDKEPGPRRRFEREA
jgi:hypothetical protein